MVNAVLLSESVTVTPAADADCDSITQQVELEFAGTVFDEHCTPETAFGGAVIVRTVVFELPLSVAVMVTAVSAGTAPELTVKYAVEFPDATVTVAGTVRAVLLSESVTVEPPAGAACESVTQQVELELAATVLDEHCSEFTETSVPVTTGVIMSLWICACVSGRLYTRTSSMVPAKYCPKRLSPPICSGFADVSMLPVCARMEAGTPFT